MSLLALTLACLHAPIGDSARLAPDIVGALEARPIPVYSRELDACLVATYMRHESGARLHPRAESWDARAGVSCGPLQMACGRVAGRSVAWQVARWLDDVAASSLGAVDSSPSRAAGRLEEARREVARVGG